MEQSINPLIWMIFAVLWICAALKYGLPAYRRQRQDTKTQNDFDRAMTRYKKMREGADQ